MNRRKALTEWIDGERQRLDHQIDLFSSGRAQMSELRKGRWLDVTGEFLKNLEGRKKELDSHAESLGEDPGFSGK